MSEEIFMENGLYVTRYVGPASLEDRMLWQITATMPGETAYVSFTREQLQRLVSALSHDLEDTGSLA